jgi:hypothetical protein
MRTTFVDKPDELTKTIKDNVQRQGGQVGGADSSSSDSGDDDEVET